MNIYNGDNKRQQRIKLQWCKTPFKPNATQCNLMQGLRGISGPTPEEEES